MKREEAINIVKGARQYLMAGNPVWDIKKIDDAFSMAIEALKIDIVRCSDCKRWQDNNNGYPVADCKWNREETPDADDFCSCGVRREDGEEE